MEKYARNHPQIIQNHEKSIQNRSKIHGKSIKIDSWVVLGRFRRQIAPRLVPGRSPSFDGAAFWRLFGRKCRSKDPFLNRWETEHRSKIALVRVDGRLDLPKMASGRGFGKKQFAGPLATSVLDPSSFSFFPTCPSQLFLLPLYLPSFPSGPLANWPLSTCW